MIPELGDEHGIIGDLVYDAMLIVDPAGPVAGAYLRGSGLPLPW